MLMELLSKATTVAMLSIVVSSMLAMVAGLTVSQISEPLRNARLVLLALLANFVLMPLGALALAKVLWLDNPFWCARRVITTSLVEVVAVIRECQHLLDLCVLGWTFPDRMNAPPWFRRPWPG